MYRFSEIINVVPEEVKRSKLWVWAREEFLNEKLGTIRKKQICEDKQ